MNFYETMSSVGYNYRQLSFEQGPIRPPSEAMSLLVRITRNCPWNKCAFCKTYKGKRFSLRPLKEIKQDIETIKRVHDEIKALSWQVGCRGEVNEEVIRYLYQTPYGDSTSFMNVAMWLYYGKGSVFLQDGNNLVVKTGDLVESLTLLKKFFPGKKNHFPPFPSQYLSHFCLKSKEALYPTFPVKIYKNDSGKNILLLSISALK